MPYRCFVAIALVVISVVTAGCGGGYRTPRQQAAQHGPRAASSGDISPTQAQLLGDLDGDGQPSVGDAIKILRVVVGLDPDSACADANQNDGTDVGDAIKVLRCVVGLDAWPIAECGLAPGEAVIERVGGKVTVRGKVAFVDESGNLIGGPATGALVVIGTESMAVGTDVDGDFAIPGLPDAQDLAVVAGAPGFLPLITTIPASANSLPEKTLVCRIDIDPIDDPFIGYLRTAVGMDGIVRLHGNIPGNADVKVFHVPGATPSSPQVDTFPSSPVPVFQTEYSPGVGGTRGFQVALTTQQSPGLATGTLYTFAYEGVAGISAVNTGTCGLTLHNYDRDAGRVRGTIEGTAGAAGGADVLVCDSANFSNRVVGPAGGRTGYFDLTLPNPPAGTAPAVYIHVQWQDPNGVWLSCYFTGD